MVNLVSGNIYIVIIYFVTLFISKISFKTNLEELIFNDKEEYNAN